MKRERGLACLNDMGTGGDAASGDTKIHAGVTVERIRLAMTCAQRPLFDAISKHPGLRAQQLADRLYASRDDGGPLTADAAIRKTVHRMNVRLRRFGLRISGGYDRSGYRLEAANSTHNTIWEASA